MEIIEIENNPKKRKLIEEQEILKVKKDRNKLMNIKIVFPNEEIFYYILNNKVKQQEQNIKIDEV